MRLRVRLFTAESEVSVEEHEVPAGVELIQMDVMSDCRVKMFIGPPEKEPTPIVDSSA